MAVKFLLKQNGSNGESAADAGDEYAFDGAMFTLGSDATNDLILNGAAAEQAVVVREGDRLTLINSADGTSLNGENLRREAIQPLGAGDEIRIGKYIIFLVENDNGSNGGAPDEKSDDEKFESDETARAAFDEILTVADKNFDSQNIKFAPQTEITAAPLKTLNGKTNRTNNFAAVLDTLRTEEDSFYFVVKAVVKNKETEVARIALEQAEIPIGADDKNQIVFDIKKMTAVFGVVRKDWSGIILETSRRGAVFVNGEALDADARRLRNEDRVHFAAPVESILILHEPSLLVALEPLLSQRAVANNGENSGAAATQIAKTAKAAKPKAPLFERTFFNHFSFVEILSMIIGTLIGAVLFFLIFEFIFA